MKKENKTSLVVIDETFLLKFQYTDESGVGCFFEATVSKAIEKMPRSEKEKVLKRMNEVFISYLGLFQKEIIHEQRSKSVKPTVQKPE